MLKKLIYNKHNLVFIILFVVFSISIGYAASCSELSISNIVANIRIKADVRVTGFLYNTSVSGGISTYEEYDVNSLITNLTLPEESSSVTYTVKVTNFGNKEMGIFSINNLSSNLTYELIDYNLKEKICDESNSCINGITKTFSIKIKYADGGYDSTNTEYNLNLGVEFKSIHTITYQDITNNNYPTEIMDGETLVITFTDPVPDGIRIYQDGLGIKQSLFTYINNVLTYNNVTGNLVLSPPEPLYTMIKNSTLGTDASVDFGVAPSETNGEGVLTRNGTENDEFPVYYYRGNVTDNNVIFGNFCWKIVRTTSTGGTKLIYNGVPSEEGSCDNTGEASTIGRSDFNSNSNSPADVGYMYGDRYEINPKYNSTQVWYTYKSVSDTSKYYYGTSISKRTLGGYNLSSPTLSGEYSYSYSDFVGKYTCFSSSKKYCTGDYYYIYDAESWGSVYGIKLSEGQTIESLNLVTVSDSIIDNGDGTYLLGNPIAMNFLEWQSGYSQYLGYYVCPNMTDTTCSNPQVIVETDLDSLAYSDKPSSNYIYGNDITYGDGKYTLVNPYISSNGWYKDYSTIQNNRYTCLNTTGECENVYYIIYVDSSKMYYLTLSEGKDLEGTKDEMFTNTNDSTIKTAIDTWYESNLINYTEKLEDTVWCNDRSISSGSLKSKDAEHSSSHFGSYTRTRAPYEFSYTCPNENDNFTVSEENGNGALTYSVGMLTADEIALAGNGVITAGYSKDTYLNSNADFLTLSPSDSYYANNTPFGFYYYSGYLSSYSANGFIRPSISLKYGTKIMGGTGSVTNPYIVE